MKLSTLRTNSNLERAGIWRDFEDVSFHIASTQTPAYKRAVARNMQNVPSGKVRNDPALLDKPLIRSMAESILLGWKGDIQDGDKILNPASLGDRIKVLEIHAIREWVSAQAADLANFQAAEDAAEVDALKSDPDMETEERGEG